LTDIVINGNAYPLLTSTYEIKSKGQGSKTAKRVLGGAGLGALIGVLREEEKELPLAQAPVLPQGQRSSGATKGEQLVIPGESLLEIPASATRVAPSGAVAELARQSVVSSRTEIARFKVNPSPPTR